MAPNMFRTVIHLLVFLLALAPAAALAGGKAPVNGKKVTRTLRATGKLTIVRVNRVVRPLRTKMATTDKGTKAQPNSTKQPRRGKVLRTYKRTRLMALRTSRPSTLVALANALSGGTRHKRVLKKRVPKRRIKSSSSVRVVIVRHVPRGALSSNLRYMAKQLVPGSDLRQADLQLMKLED